jgi:hypothetical protein
MAGGMAPMEGASAPQSDSLGSGLKDLFSSVANVVNTAAQAIATVKGLVEGQTPGSASVTPEG